ncbi:MAG: cadherin-like domain-containing protein, partial [Oscillatoria sp. PMC 1068.18]|nr:cadherin-like domain-containing protein [Oscillatoria sp. PMC 1068.18]
NLADLTGFIDAEGLTTDPNTGELYVVFDNDSGSGDRVARLDILHAPELTDISLSGVEDTPISFTAEDFADGFSDVDGDELASITVTSLPDSGLLTLNGSRVSEGQAIATADLDNLVYTPDDDFFGTDSFEFTASDGTRESDTATVNLQVNSNAGISLELLDSFEFLSGDGIAFDPTTGNLFIAQTFVNSFFNPTFEADRAVFQVTSDGVEISNFTPEELRTAIGLSILPDGNLLISDVITGRILEYTPEGEIAPGGIDFAREEFGLDFDGDGAADPGDKSPPTGVAYNPDTETIFVLDSRGPQIFEFDTDGTLLSTLDLTGITPPGNGGPQGMAIDPLTGNFLIVNDGRTSNGEFASTLFEVSSEGELLSTTNLADLTGFIDAEGLTTDPETGELYVVFDNDSGSGDRVARLDILHAPELDRIKKSFNEDTPISFTSEDFSDAFSDVDGDELASITIETAPENGDLTLNGSRIRGGQTITAADLDNLVYTPDEDFFGLDTLEISASDGTKSSATATIDLLVNANEGLQFNLISSFAGGGDGVAYIPETGNIYAIDTEILGPGQFEWTVTEYTPEGEEVNEFTSEVFATALGGTALPNGNLLILSPRFGELVEFTPDGEEVVGGIDIQNDALAVPNATLRGVAYDEATESIFVLDSAAIITNIDTEGNILSTLNFAESLPANQSVQGITIDPLTGNFLIVDQFDNGANNSIYEVTASGELVATTDLLALTGIDDPEGISLDPETRTVYVAFDDDGNNGSQIGIFSLSPVSPLENAQGNPTGIFNFTGVDTNLVVSPVVNSSGEIQEVGVYTVDDEEGTIDGIAPGEDGYLEAAIERANVLFSLISDLPNGFDPSELQRVLDFDAGTNLGFLQVTNGTINSVQEDLATDGSTDAEVVLSTETDLETTLSSNGFTLNWNDEFSIQVEGKRAATVSVPVGTGLQNSQQLEVIDLRNETASSFQVDATLYREAALENFVGLYKIENTNGDVRDPVTGNLVNPGDDDYLEVALANRLPAFDYTVPNQTVATSSATLSGNDLIAPFIVAGDPVAPLLDGSDNEIPEVYFPFIGANPDGADHIRLIGDNAFVFEDLPNAGDSDFNDMILNLEFTAIA